MPTAANPQSLLAHKIAQFPWAGEYAFLHDRGISKMILQQVTASRSGLDEKSKEWVDGFVHEAATESLSLIQARQRLATCLAASELPFSFPNRSRARTFYEGAGPVALGGLAYLAGMNLLATPDGWIAPATVLVGAVVNNAIFHQYGGCYHDLFKDPRSAFDSRALAILGVALASLATLITVPLTGLDEFRVKVTEVTAILPLLVAGPVQLSYNSRESGRIAALRAAAMGSRWLIGALDTRGGVKNDHLAISWTFYRHLESSPQAIKPYLQQWLVATKKMLQYSRSRLVNPDPNSPRLTEINNARDVMERSIADCDRLYTALHADGDYPFDEFLALMARVENLQRSS